MEKLLKQVEQLNKQIAILQKTSNLEHEKELKVLKRGLKIHEKFELDCSNSVRVNGWLIPKHIGWNSGVEYTIHEYHNKYPHTKIKKRKAMKRLRKAN